MKRRQLTRSSVPLFGATLFGMVAIAPVSATAESISSSGGFDVAINLGEAVRSSIGFSLGDVFYSQSSDGLSPGRGVSQSPQLPDSLHFAGLAGTLNLAIDKSNGEPLVEGIELAPREILRFNAADSDGIRGLYGRISIRLDF